MKKFLIIVALVAALLAVPAAQSDSGGVYAKESYCVQYWLIRGYNPKGVWCNGLSAGSHPSKYFSGQYHYILFDVHTLEFGVRRYHMRPDGSMRWDQSVWAGPES